MTIFKTDESLASTASKGSVRQGKRSVPETCSRDTEQKETNALDPFLVARPVTCRNVRDVKSDIESSSSSSSSLEDDRWSNFRKCWRFTFTDSREKKGKWKLFPLYLRTYNGWNNHLSTLSKVEMNTVTEFPSINVRDESRLTLRLTKTRTTMIVSFIMVH